MLEPTSHTCFDGELPVGAGEPGPVTKRIQQRFMATVRGELEQYRRWLEFT